MKYASSLVVAVLVTAACGGRTADRAEPPAAAADPVGPATAAGDLEMADRMVGHFIEITAIERALIDGHLDEVRARASALAGADMRAEWGGELVRFREAALEIERSVDLPAAAMAVADTAARCGACHRAHDVVYRPPPLPEPADPASVDARMKRHQWATHLLRAAIVFTSVELWDAGVQVIVEAPLDPSELSGEGPLDPDVATWVDNTRAMGAAAIGAAPADWSHIYGELLTSCVGCHRTER